MESSTADPLNDTPTLPELSFDDLLDKSPETKSFDLSDDPQEGDNEKKTTDDDTLNTPGPKKSRAVAASKEDVSIQDSVTNTAATISSDIKTPTTPTTPTRPRADYAGARNPVQRSNSTTGVVTVAATTISPTILNSKNILSKTRTTASNPLIKIAPKTNAGTTLISSTTALTAGSASGPKTAVKTANGQILYIQKASGGLPAVRLAPSTTSTATTAAASSPSFTTNANATVGAAAGTTSNGNKTVAIQVLRSSDGSLLPLKPAGASTAKNSLTLSPTIANQLTGKKIITTSGNQVVIKGPIKAPTPNANPTSITSTAAPSKDATKTKVQKYVPFVATSATGKTSVTATSTVVTTGKNDASKTAAPGKIVVQKSNGKQIVVSNQNLIKLSPKPAAGGGAATSTSTSGGQLQAIQIPGKPGLQYVRVLPNTKIITTASNTTSVASVTTTTATTSNAASANTTTTTAVKILNPASQKITVVRSAGGTTKMLVTQSPKKDGVPVTFSPVTTKVQKTIVTVPTLRKIVDHNSSAVPSNDNASTTPSSPNMKSGNNSGVSTVNLVRKHKISEINSQIQRMASGQPELKKPASGNRIVVMSRSMLRSNNTPATLHNKTVVKSGNTQEKKLLLEPQQQNNKVQVTASEQSASTSSPKKLYSVLKSNTEPHPVDIKTSAELKSLIICGQAQALMAQQQQHKTQMMQKQRNLLQQQQQQKQQLQLQQQKRQQQQQQQQTLLQKTSQQNKFVSVKIKQEPTEGVDVKPTLEEAVATVRRKHCNCTKSQCLKLYCDCFANGEFCQDCNCKDCFNNLQYEDERQKAIRNCLERNPSAFKPKITTAQDQGDMRLHNKGCNCKRSGCLKNYCECYEAKIPCSSNCKCFGCRNIEDRPDLDMDPVDSKILSTLVNSSGGTMLAGQKRTYDKMDKNSKLLKDISKTITNSSNSNEQIISGSAPPPEKQQCNFITQEVIDATIQCMISQADECEKNGLPAFQTEKLVMEELGRCLVEIIDFSIRNTDTSYSQE